MSEASWPWSLLDIARTDDRKTIREAYARKLKALDPDSATEAFMNLRDARDAALSGEFLDMSDEFPGDEVPVGDMSDELDDIPAAAPPLDIALADETAGRPQFTVEYDESDDNRFHRMVELLTGEGELSTTETAELEGHLDTMFADHRMADLGHFARVEIWLAELLAQRYPRAARLFPQVADKFQWNERAHELGIHPAIPWLVGAHEGQALFEEIGRNDHPYHREWIELAQGRPEGPLFFRAIDNGRMGNLITSVRRDFPWLEQAHWQPELVARWEKRVEGGGVRGPGVWTWIVLVFLALSAIGKFAGVDSSRIDHNPAALAALQATKADEHIAEFISTQFPSAQADGRSVETLRARSPKTYFILQSVADRFDTVDEARNRIISREIAEIYYLIIDKMPYEMQIADAKFRAATIRKMRDNPRGCAEFIRNPRTYLRQGNSADAISPEYRYHMFSVVHDQYGDREWALVPKDVKISGDIVGKLIKRAGLPEKRIAAVIQARDASEADICITMGSFYELLTEIPAKEASPILPVLL
ncbi:MAG: hypothetical protein Q7T68_19550 [Sphingopyxis sp.]|nr:hypothetical protein [Sphingopyxis sp.]